MDGNKARQWWAIAIAYAFHAHRRFAGSKPGWWNDEALLELSAKVVSAAEPHHYSPTALRMRAFVLGCPCHGEWGEGSRSLEQMREGEACWARLVDRREGERKDDADQLAHARECISIREQHNRPANTLYTATVPEFEPHATRGGPAVPASQPAMMANVWAFGWARGSGRGHVECAGCGAEGQCHDHCGEVTA